MQARLVLALITFILGVGLPAGVQDQMPKPDQDEWLRLIRNDRLDLILPSAMRDNNVDMWIHAARQGNPDPLAYEFGRIGGFIIFTDLGDRAERAVFGEVFGGGGAIENIDVVGSMAISRALTGYDHGNVDFEVYDELREYVESHNPQTIAVNFSDWLAVADSISYTQYRKLEQILGPELSSRIVSAEHLITDFRSRRLSLEVAIQAITLEAARQAAIAQLESIVPGETKLSDLRRASVLYSATPPKARRRRGPPPRPTVATTCFRAAISSASTTVSSGSSISGSPRFRSIPNSRRTSFGKARRRFRRASSGRGTSARGRRESCDSTYGSA